MYDPRWLQTVTGGNVVHRYVCIPSVHVCHVTLIANIRNVVV
jgi:hypothetical protein